ncbi:MAG: RluA family pseudouridine synthase [Pseudoflavonifractor sp.]|nr:RluA family pseudouridine synthase [Pseudoflavonifractor sp.]
MKEFTIGKNDAGQRLDRWLGKAVPLLPAPLAQKYIRLKRVKVNGKGSQRDARLQAGDLLQLYINDEFFDTPTEDNAFLSVFQPQLDILYEDENLLVCNKRPGLLCHPDEHEYVSTLITHIQAYLYQKKEWSPRWENAFAPALCNRIDRNTGGLVIAAKTAEALRVMNDKIKDREISKFYLAAVVGKMSPSQGELRGFLLKDEAKKQVSVYQRPVPGGKSAATRYRTLAVQGGLSLVECELLTGRTHQIRAQFAAAGHPLAGDGKYGRREDNRNVDRRGQALWSYKLVFDFPTDAGCLEGLRGKTLAVPVGQIDFVSEWFPNVRL